MAATSLKLPEDLKRRIERVAAAVQKTPHAFMVEALSQETKRAELREKFAADADQAEKGALKTGKAFDLTETFDYLTARVSGKKIRRPKARTWRASK